MLAIFAANVTGVIRKAKSVQVKNINHIIERGDHENQNFKTGTLVVDGTVKYCPFSTNSECGDWCALFRTGHLAASKKAPAVNWVDLCQKVYECPESDFTDERKAP